MSTGRRVVITAGAGGIGLALALAFAQQAFAANGDRVHICDINEQALHDITDSNAAITATVCDVSNRSSVEAFVTTAAETVKLATRVSGPVKMHPASASSSRESGLLDRLALITGAVGRGSPALDCLADHDPTVLDGDHPDVDNKLSRLHAAADPRPALDCATRRCCG